MANIKISGIFAGMLIDIAPYAYVPYSTTERKVINKLITQCMNAMYGTMVLSLMYYCKCYKTLKLNKFEMNPYYPCVDNQLVNGLQQSILFHVDDCKLRHKNPKVNESFIEVIHEEYQSIF